MTMSEPLTKHIQDITHGIVVVDPITEDILEFVGYWSAITPESIAELRVECDERYGAKNYILYFATPDMIEHFKNSDPSPL